MGQNQFRISVSRVALAARPLSSHFPIVTNSTSLPAVGRIKRAVLRERERGNAGDNPQKVRHLRLEASRFSRKMAPSPELRIVYFAPRIEPEAPFSPPTRYVAQLKLAGACISLRRWWKRPRVLANAACRSSPDNAVARERFSPKNHRPADDRPRWSAEWIISSIEFCGLTALRSI